MPITTVQKNVRHNNINNKNDMLAVAAARVKVTILEMRQQLADNSFKFGNNFKKLADPITILYFPLIIVVNGHAFTAALPLVRFQFELLQVALKLHTAAILVSCLFLFCEAPLGGF